VRQLGTTTRRAVLRGLGGIGLALPFLEAALPRRGAQAAAPAKKTRLVVWYTSTGTVLANWRPATLGTDWAPPSILAPIATPLLKPKLTVLSGIRMAAAQSLPGNGHAKGMACMLTARPFKDIEKTDFGDVGWGGGISIDQEIARRLVEPGKLKSIETGVLTRGGGMTEYMSYADGGGQAGVVPAEGDPRKVWTRLFASVPDSDVARATLEAVVRQRKSVLDLVKSDFDRVNARLGGQDRQRLDKHLTLVRELEARVQVGHYCSRPGSPDVKDGDPRRNALIPVMGKLQMDLVSTGLGCDLTRVATIQWSGAQSEFDFKDLLPQAPWRDLSCPPQIDTCTQGLNTAQHTISHIAADTSRGLPATMTPPQAAATACITAIARFYSEQLAYFAGQLAAQPDPAGGTLLDNTVILCVTEVSEGPTHAYTNMPFLLLGGGGGRLRAGHFDFKNERTTNDLFVTVGRAVGLEDMATFGDPSLVKGVLSELLV
jgi:hypothetical protein